MIEDIQNDEGHKGIRRAQADLNSQLLTAKRAQSMLFPEPRSMSMRSLFKGVTRLNSVAEVAITALWGRGQEAVKTCP